MGSKKTNKSGGARFEGGEMEGERTSGQAGGFGPADVAAAEDGGRQLPALAIVPPGRNILVHMTRHWRVWLKSKVAPRLFSVCPGGTTGELPKIFLIVFHQNQSKS